MTPLFTATIMATATAKAIAAAVMAMVVAVTVMEMAATDYQQYRFKVLGKLSGTFLQVQI